MFDELLIKRHIVIEYMLAIEGKKILYRAHRHNQTCSFSLHVSIQLQHINIIIIRMLHISQRPEYNRR